MNKEHLKSIVRFIEFFVNGGNPEGYFGGHLSRSNMEFDMLPEYYSLYLSREWMIERLHLIEAFASGKKFKLESGAVFSYEYYNFDWNIEGISLAE